jgi:hypothetical protein
MTVEERPAAIGEVVPDVPLETFDGREFRISWLRGRPLLVVCVRYYG